ncbi:CBS domain-containing protein [Streptomyces virginiae]|uniref:CBS domain-containing protein n=1 Tax=Streptomyces virginiae TaxID=1961 RepID=UPI00352DD3B1
MRSCTMPPPPSRSSLTTDGPTHKGDRTMSHRTVADVMTRNVATTGPEASLKAVARSLDDNGVSALPVVDTRHHPIGIVSEADLLRRQAGLPDTEGRDPLQSTAPWTVPPWTPGPPAI